MTDTPDPLESSFQAAFAEVVAPRDGDAARLRGMVERAVAAAPVAPPVAGGSALKLVAGIGMAAGAVALAFVLASTDRTPEATSAAAPVVAEPAAMPEAPSDPPRDDRPPSVVSPPPVERPAAVEEPAIAREAEPEPVSTRRPKAPTTEPETASGLLARANEARRAGDFGAADRLYDDLQARFPRSREATLALVTHGRLLLDELDRPGDALVCFTAYLDARPQGTLAEEAMVGRARALERAGTATEAEAAWTELRARFPDSVHARP